MGRNEDEGRKGGRKELGRKELGRRERQAREGSSKKVYPSISSPKHHSLKGGREGGREGERERERKVNNINMNHKCTNGEPQTAHSIEA